MIFYRGNEKKKKIMIEILIALILLIWIVGCIAFMKIECDAKPLTNDSRFVVAGCESKDNFIPIKECPWSKKQQKKIKKICDKYSISFDMCVAQAKRESDWNGKAVGDTGKAYGAWQIHPSEWRNELSRWGYSANDMFDLYKACEVYCKIMVAHFEKYEDVEFALMAWNGGGRYASRMINSNKVSDYALEVIDNTKRYERRYDNGTISD